MAFARTDTLDQRAAILGRLIWRNRLVGVLRIAIPAAGIVAFAGLSIEIYVASIIHQYGVSGMRIDRGKLVVETPQYTGMGTDGSRYVLNAAEASTPIGHSSLIDMTDARLDFMKAGGATFHATGAQASFDTDRQYVTVPGIATLHSEDGLHGTLTEVRSDMKAEMTDALGPVDITFADGSNLTAANMHYDGKADIWTFGQATLVVPDLPEPAFPPVPFAVGAWVRL